MDYEALLANITRLLAQKGLSAHAASQKAGHGDAIRNLQRGVKSGHITSWKLETLCDISRALGVEPWELLKPTTAQENSADLRSLIRQEVQKAIRTPVRRPRRKAG